MTHPKALTAINNLGLTIDEYKEFLVELASSVEELIQEVKKNIDVKNAKSSSEIIHSIKGSVGSLGLTSAYSRCQNIESELKKGINENSMVLLEEFIKIYTDELAEIQQTL